VLAKPSAALNLTKLVQDKPIVTRAKTITTTTWTR
ncbi:uncharacterized protein METZ01_LOCUS366343, partial [marine metagenome]